MSRLSNNYFKVGNRFFFFEHRNYAQVYEKARTYAIMRNETLFAWALRPWMRGVVEIGDLTWAENQDSPLNSPPSRAT